jgi:protein tyrosine/serine phosphatase
MEYLFAGLRVSYDYLVGKSNDLLTYFNEDADIKSTKVKRIYTKLPKLTQLSWFFGHPTYIKDKIYLGSAFNAATKSTLDTLNIKYIINVTDKIENYFPGCYEYETYLIEDNDQQHITPYLEVSYQKIKEFQQNNDGNILIHCVMGASRSASIVCYYLMREYRFTPKEIYHAMKLKRECVNPSHTFYHNLCDEYKKINR